MYFKKTFRDVQLAYIQSKVGHCFNFRTATPVLVCGCQRGLSEGLTV